MKIKFSTFIKMARLLGMEQNLRFVVPPQLKDHIIKTQSKRRLTFW